MNLTGKSVRRGVGGAVFGGLAMAMVAVPMVGAPVAAAEPCRADAATATISQVSGAASQYLASHPGANDALSNALTQPRDQATNTVRSYFVANPGEYFDLKNITAPLQTLRNQCGGSFAGSDLISAFDEFQMG
jgi:hemophore-related protein